VRDGAKPLAEALHEYEAEMLHYSAEAVLESRKQMDARDVSHRPVLGPIQPCHCANGNAFRERRSSTEAPYVRIGDAAAQSGSGQGQTVVQR
jgi:hypothetical protein